ncbi:MAG: type II toxin-antitoxin system VapC family toxin [Acidobacteriaceae bacterium]
MILLDTNVLSEPTKPSGDERVAAWLDRQEIRSLFVTSINLAELMVGVAMLPEGRRRQALRSALDQFLAKRIVTPILPFDREAALAYADVVAYAKVKRYTLPVADGQIAAIAKVHGFAVATRDVEPFVAAGVRVINPWEDE